MRLDGRYEIVGVLEARAGALLQAVDRESGRPVLVRILASRAAADARTRPGVIRLEEGVSADVLITEDTPAWREWPVYAPLPAGEFTSLFRGPSVVREAPKASPAETPSLPAGDFTSLFSAPPAASSASLPPPVAPPVAPASSEPGDFTRFLQQPMAANPNPLPANMPVIEAPSGKPFSEPGDFTKFFVGSNTPQRSSAPSGDATGIFAASAPSASHAAGEAAGSSEYTSFLRASNAPPQATPPPAPAPVAPPPASGMPAWLVALLAAAGAMMLILAIVKLAQ